MRTELRDRAADGKLLAAVVKDIKHLLNPPDADLIDQDLGALWDPKLGEVASGVDWSSTLFEEHRYRSDRATDRRAEGDIGDMTVIILDRRPTEGCEATSHAGWSKRQRASSSATPNTPLRDRLGRRSKTASEPAKQSYDPTCSQRTAVGRAHSLGTDRWSPVDSNGNDAE